VKLHVDEAAGVLVVEDPDPRSVPLYSPEAFELLSDLWVRVGWDQKYSYTFSWLGRPIIQLPEDMVRLQEVVWRLQPDLIVETGVAHGGSAVFLAGLCRLAGKGRVVAVDIEIRPHNRAAIEAHSLRDLITLIEGSSTDPDVVSQVQGVANGLGTVLVILDSDHSYAHVAAELEAYAPMVTPGSYIVATDGLMRDVASAPRGQASWDMDNPANAAEAFAAANPSFVLATPEWPFSESSLAQNVTHWPSAWLQRQGHDGA
jgi:cephalosporin hydroxylase